MGLDQGQRVSVSRKRGIPVGMLLAGWRAKNILFGTSSPVFLQPGKVKCGLHWAPASEKTSILWLALSFLAQLTKYFHILDSHDDPGGTLKLRRLM